MRIGEIEDGIFQIAIAAKIKGFSFDSRNRYSCKIDGKQTVICGNGKSRVQSARDLLDLWANAADMHQYLKNQAWALRNQI